MVSLSTSVDDMEHWNHNISIVIEIDILMSHYSLFPCGTFI